MNVLRPVCVCAVIAAMIRLMVAAPIGFSITNFIVCGGEEKCVACATHIRIGRTGFAGLFPSIARSVQHAFVAFMDMRN